MRSDWAKFSTHPRAVYWSPKNDVTPDQVPLNTHKYFLFDCDRCDHEFFATTSTVNSGSWCPYCNSGRICGKEGCEPCFEKSLASNEKAVKCWSSLNNLSPIQVTKNCNTKYWIDCDKCPHTFETSPRSLSLYNNSCPYCRSAKLCDDEGCDFCHEKSFASHPSAIYWCKKNELTPRQVRKNFGGMCWFYCVECGHSHDVRLDYIILVGTACRYCSQILCEDADCEICYQRSFASHENARYWSEKNHITPRMLRLQSGEKCWFDCYNCGHTFNTRVSSVSGGKWCPYCRRSSHTFCEDIDCEFCLAKSFVSHPKVKYWSAENEDDPKRVSLGSARKYKFICKKGHWFEAPPCTIRDGSWCPHCVNKTETKFYETMQPIYPDLLKQFKAEWCKNIRYLPFDFCLEDSRIIIEVDGRQHHIQVSNWTSPEETHKNDLYKMKCANENGYSMIRIYQPDVWNDTIDWVNLVKQAVSRIIEEGIVQNLYISSEDLYSDFPQEAVTE